MNELPVNTQHTIYCLHGITYFFEDGNIDLHELLLYIISKLNVDNLVDNKKVVIILYVEEVLNGAKAALWSAYTETLDRPHIKSKDY